MKGEGNTKTEFVPTNWGHFLVNGGNEKPKGEEIDLEKTMPGGVIGDFDGSRRVIRCPSKVQLPSPLEFKLIRL